MKNMLTNLALKEQLNTLFRDRREVMVLDFIHNNFEIMRPMFLYENDVVLIRLSIESYILSWINSHWIVLDQMSFNSEEEKSAAERILYQFVIDFLNDMKENTLESTDLFRELIKSKIDFYNDLFDISKKTVKRQNQLKYSYERDTVLFERIISEEVKKRENT